MYARMYKVREVRAVPGDLHQLDVVRRLHHRVSAVRVDRPTGQVRADSVAERSTVPQGELARERARSQHDAQ